MIEVDNPAAHRRNFLMGTACALGILALPGCATIADWTYNDAIRRLLERATRNAFARLTAEDGFWNSSVARIGLPDLFGNRGSVAEGIFTSAIFRDQLQRRLNRVAERGARRAAPIVADAVRTIEPANAIAIMRGRPDAATALLRGGMGLALVNAMVPELGDAMRIANDPVLGRALAALSGVDVSAVSQALAVDVDNAIWAEVSAAEREIRSNPESTGDAVLIAALRGV